MQAIILAAGNSTRTYPLTITRPKPLLKVADTTILEHNLEQLGGLVDEVIIIVSYKKEQIINRIGTKYKKMPVRYIEQKEPLGTGHALLQAKAAIKDKFLVMNGDDLFYKKDIKACLGKDYCVLAAEVDEPGSFGVLNATRKYLKSLEEKPSSPKSSLVNTGLYVFNQKVFNIELHKSERGEYEITEYLEKLIPKKVYVQRVKYYWLPVRFPWDLLFANTTLMELLEYRKVDRRGVTINGNVQIGEGTDLLPGTYIEGNVIIGEFCKIGPNCYIRGHTTIGNRCHVGQAVEIKNSIIMNNSKVPHLSYIGDSIIGENVNLGAGTITANLRHDNQSIITPVKGTLVQTGRRKLGAIIGDNVHTGINTCIYPGRKIWPMCSTVPGQVVKEDITCAE